MFLKGSRVIAEFIEKDAQSPDIALLVDRSPEVDVNHFRSAILEGGVSVEVRLKHAELLRI